MGLFSGLKKIVSAVPVVGDIVNASANKKAIKNAAAAQAAALGEAKTLIGQRQDENQAAFSPYIGAGTDALSSLEAILGLSGGDAQGASIAGLRESPLFRSLFRSGEEAVLQNASATGGLRGGNTAPSLYSLGEDTLARVIQQQIANLSGLSSQGLGATGQLASLNNGLTGSLADLILGGGKNEAGKILGVQNVNNSLSSSLSGSINGLIREATGQDIGGLIGNGLKSLGGSLFGGGAALNASGLSGLLSGSAGGTGVGALKALTQSAGW